MRIVATGTELPSKSQGKEVLVLAPEVVRYSGMMAGMLEIVCREKVPYICSSDKVWELWPQFTPCSAGEFPFQNSSKNFSYRYGLR